MKLTRIRALRGPNLWSRHTSIEVVVECDESERSLDSLPGVEARLRTRFPALGGLLPAASHGPLSMAHALETRPPISPAARRAPDERAFSPTQARTTPRPRPARSGCSRR